MLNKKNVGLGASALLTGVVACLTINSFSEKSAEKHIEIEKSAGPCYIKTLESVEDKKVFETLEDLSQKKGVERKAAWQTATVGLRTDQNTSIRIRSARLVKKLSANSNISSEITQNKNTIKLLMESLDSGDAELVHHSFQALGTMSLIVPEFEFKKQCVEKAKKLLASENADLSRAALVSLPMFKTTEVIPDILHAWKKHEQIKDFEKSAVETMRCLQYSTTK